MAAAIEVTDPTSVGMDPNRLQRVADYARSYVDEGKLIGTEVLVARHGKVVLRSKAGLADRENQTPIVDNTLWRFYSMTKPLTSVAIMQLVEEGKLRLSDPLHEFVPAFATQNVFCGGTAEDPQTEPAHQRITIADLLTHTAGLTYSFIVQHPVDEIYRNSGLDAMAGHGDLATTIDALAALPLRNQPGTRWSYSMATDVLGRVVEVVSGQPFAQRLKSHVLDPLEMYDTAFAVPDEKLDRFAACYMPTPEGGEPVLIDSAETSSFRNDAWSSGGGGIVSSLEDYHRFCQMLLKGGRHNGQQIIGPRTLNLMMRNHLPEGQDLEEVGDTLFVKGLFTGVGFGLGFSVVQDTAAGHLLASEGEASWGGMASTAFWVDPKEQISAIFLTQLVPSSTYINLRWDLRTLVNQALVD